jgi:hypothetical protein
LQNQQEQSSFQRDDVHGWLVSNGRFHENNVIAGQHFQFAFSQKGVGDGITIAVKTQVCRWRSSPGFRFAPPDYGSCKEVAMGCEGSGI